MNADRDRSEQPCTDTRCDAPIHPLDTEGALLPPITEPIALGDPESVALYAPESPAAPDTSTDTPETREGAREAHSEPRGLPEWMAEKNAEVDALRAEVERLRTAVLEFERAYVGERGDRDAAERALAVERARVARVDALADEWLSEFGPASELENVMGQQSVTIETAVCLIRAALAEPEHEGRA